MVPGDYFSALHIALSHDKKKRKNATKVHMYLHEPCWASLLMPEYNKK